MRRRCLIAAVSILLAWADLRTAAADEVTVCTQNLWNYGLPEVVQKLRRRADRIASIRASLARQEQALAARLSGCDIIAFQELLGEDDHQARAALDRLGAVLEERTGHLYRGRMADTRDVIRNGFLLRTDAALTEVSFDGRHSSDRLPSIPAFPQVSWDRGPAELVVELRQNVPVRGRDDRGVPGAHKAQSTREAERAPVAARLRLRVVTAHLKSKSAREGSDDPDGEHWERRRVVQAGAILDLARRRQRERPAELLFVVGDINCDRGSAARAVLTGEIDPATLLSPHDCIGSEGQVECELPHRSRVLLDLADRDPDLRGRGSYRFGGREELIDGIFASPRAASLARKPGAAPDDYDVELAGRLYEGSDHRLLRVTLRY